MGWYQTASQQAQWKTLLVTQNFQLKKFFNSNLFMEQVKLSNPTIISFLQTNYQLVFGTLLDRCLIVPSNSDSHERKFKQPTQSMNLLQMVLDKNISNNQNNNLPKSSITESMAFGQVCTFNGKITSINAIKYIVENTFALFQRNTPKKLENTMIPGYFQQIFELLNKNYCQVLIDYLKTSKIVQKLVQKYSYFDQLIKCIQSVLIVHFGTTNQQLNIKASVSMSMSMAPQQSSVQPNYPYQIKYRLLMQTFRIMADYAKIKHNEMNKQMVIQNLIGLLIEILKCAHNIFEGSSLSDTICTQQNINIYFKLAKLSSIQSQTPQLQCKAIQLIRYAITYISNVTKSNLQQQFTDLIMHLMKFDKPKIKTINIIQLLIEWIGNEYGIIYNPLRLNKSISDSSFSEGLSQIQNSYIGQTITKNHVYRELVRKCTKFPSYNIFHKKVTQLFLVTFRTKSQILINSIFKDNDIIRQTVTKLESPKKNQYFGIFIEIIEICSKQKIQTQCINKVISENQKIWVQFTTNLLIPYLTKLNGKCGEMNHPESSHKSIYIVNQNYINAKKQKEEEDKKMKIQQKKKQTDDQPIDIIKIQMPSLPNKQESELDNQAEQQSFQNFLQKKMKESQQQINKQKKKALSKTPTKMRSVSAKKKKWTALSQQDQNISANKNTTLKSKIMKKDLQNNIKLVKIRKSQMPRQPKQRKISKADNKLIKWLGQVRQNSISHLQAVR